MSADRIFAGKTLDQSEHSEQKAVFSGAPSDRLLGLNLSDMLSLVFNLPKVQSSTLRLLAVGVYRMVGKGASVGKGFFFCRLIRSQSSLLFLDTLVFGKDFIRHSNFLMMENSSVSFPKLGFLDDNLRVSILVYISKHISFLFYQFKQKNFSKRQSIKQANHQIQNKHKIRKIKYIFFDF